MNFKYQRSYEKISYKYFINLLYAILFCRSLVGCVRVDSVFQPTLVPTFQFLMNIIEIQVLKLYNTFFDFVTNIFVK